MAIRVVFIGILILALSDYSQSQNDDSKFLEAISKYQLPPGFCDHLNHKKICDLIKDIKEVSSTYKQETDNFARRIHSIKKKRGKIDKKEKRRITSDFERFKKNFQTDMRKIRRKRLHLPRTNLENANVLVLIQKIVQHLVTIPQKISWMLFGDGSIFQPTGPTPTTTEPSSSAVIDSSSESESEEDYVEE